jgi:hypothetical protein
MYTVFYKDYKGDWIKDRTYKTKAAAQRRLKKLNVQQGTVQVDV